MKIGKHAGYRAKFLEISGYIFPTIKSPLGKVLFVSDERIWWIPEESARKEKVIL